MADPISLSEPTPVEQTYEKVRAAIAPDTAPDGALFEVAPNIRVVSLRTPTLPPAAHTNCYVIGPTIGTGPLLLVDPGSPYPESQQALDAILQSEAQAGRPATAALLTHHHADHVGGARHLRKRWNLDILAHPHTATLGAARGLVTRPLWEGRLRHGDLEVELVSTPGHAVGHLCIKVPSAGATIAGDLVAGMGTILIDPDEGDMIEYLASLERLAAAAPGALLPAHGPMIPDGEAKLAAYREHRLARERKIIDALASARRASAEELVPLAYTDTPTPFWPLAVRSTLAHLLKLERDGRAQRDGACWIAC